MEIRYEVKDIYGNRLNYIIEEDKEAKEAVKTLTRRECINDYDIEALKKLGHNVIEVVRAGSKIINVE